MKFIQPTAAETVSPAAGALGEELEDRCEQLFASFQEAARDIGMTEPEAVPLAILAFQMMAARLAAFPMIYDGSPYPSADFALSARNCADFARDAVLQKRSILH
jgi:hypothetical protein